MKGILLTNIGTPDQPTPKAVRRFLKKFLSDKRVVEISRTIWYPILYGIILPFRSRRSAKLYQKIWTEKGSPLLTYSQKIATQLQQTLNYPVELGMHYSEPSIKTALTKLQNHSISELVVLPLYPQYSATTTASTFDLVAQTLKSWRNLPTIYFQKDYALNEYYLRAIAQSIDNARQQDGNRFLVFSFHGIPKRFVDLGDPYPERCRLTAEAIAKKLQLNHDEYAIAFQSRLGRAEWLKPYTDEIFKSLPKRGVKDIHVVCPGFSVDCLETLEEIAIRGKEQFFKNGGERFDYIPALNDNEAHIQLLAGLLSS